MVTIKVTSSIYISAQLIQTLIAFSRNQDLHKNLLTHRDPRDFPVCI